MKIVWLFCEGPHDAAFLTRILTTFDYKDVSADYTLDTIKTHNFKIYTLLKGYLEMYAGLGYKLDKFQSRPTIFKPNNDDDTWILLYLTDGNTNFSKVYDILRPFILSNLSKTNPVFKDVKTSVAFFNDADDGLEKAIQELQTAVNNAFKKEKFVKVQPLVLFRTLPTPIKITHVVQDIENNIFQKQGYYILCKDDKTGKLEDIILPMMEQGNEEIFDKSLQFAKDNAPKIKNKDNNEEVLLLKFDVQKATIGIAGQISIDNTKEKPKSMTGYANAVIIQKSTYLTEEKIRNNVKCQEIIKFINEMTDI